MSKAVTANESYVALGTRMNMALRSWLMSLKTQQLSMPVATVHPLIQIYTIHSQT